jgi:TetR/AcrR family transcriptional regulator, ethionamide resistance regulator
MSSQSSARPPGKHPDTKSGSPDTERAILDATRALLDEVPLGRLSVAQIIEAAGTSRATFYFYFGSKSAVVAALVKRAIAEIYEVSRPTLYAPDSPPRPEALAERVRESTRIWDTHRAVLRATVENWNSHPELRTLWVEMISGLTEAIATELNAERVAGRAPPGPDARGLAAMLAWATERCMYVIGLDLPGTLGERDSMLSALTWMWVLAMQGVPTS